MRVTEGLPDSARVLVVDDVATFGDTLGIAEEVLTARGAKLVEFALFAVDRTVLKREHASLLARVVSYARDIDNSRLWLEFPWQVADPTGPKWT
jgi:adenine/guanine phosphoribosyltransferase-like PRPP-binding protein